MAENKGKAVANSPTKNKTESKNTCFISFFFSFQNINIPIAKEIIIIALIV